MKKLKEKKYSILSNIFKYSSIMIFGFVLLSGIFLAAPSSNVQADTNISTTINNPIPSISTLPDFIQAIIKVVLEIGVPIVVLAIIYTGFLFVKAQGNPEAIKTAKASLLYTLIGAVLLLGAFVIAQAIGATVKDISTGA